MRWLGRKTFRNGIHPPEAKDETRGLAIRQFPFAPPTSAPKTERLTVARKFLYAMITELAYVNRLFFGVEHSQRGIGGSSRIVEGTNLTRRRATTTGTQSSQ